jgi:hypothetical protein
MAVSNCFQNNFTLLLSKLKFNYCINCSYLKFSLNLTVAAQWNIILVESMMTSLSSSLRANLGWVSSLLIAIIFSLKSGFSSLSLSKSFQREKNVYFMGVFFYFLKPTVNPFPHQERIFKKLTKLQFLRLLIL